MSDTRVIVPRARQVQPYRPFGYFRTVGATIDHVLERLGEVNPSLHAKAFPRMASHLKDMRGAYRDPAGPNIRYQEPLVRLAYQRQGRLFSPQRNRWPE